MNERHLHASGAVDETVDLGERHHPPALLKRREKGEAAREAESARHSNGTTRKVESRVGSYS